jgi:N-acetylglucosaminyldiphosphoundecaprenol N-acetyl-beta-D-mannosaminyltransferase
MNYKVKVLDTSLWCQNFSSLFKIVITRGQGRYNEKPFLISASGAHGIITALRDKSFKDILDSIYINLPDGLPRFGLVG